MLLSILNRLHCNICPLSNFGVCSGGFGGLLFLLLDHLGLQLVSHILFRVEDHELLEELGEYLEVGEHAQRVLFVGGRVLLLEALLLGDLTEYDEDLLHLHSEPGNAF